MIAAVWAHHGLFASGPDFDTTFGLMHTIEKAAQIYILALSAGQGKIRQTIQDEELRAIARDFGCHAAGRVFGRNSLGKMSFYETSTKSLAY